jgi:hypothetical protein
MEPSAPPHGSLTLGKGQYESCTIPCEVITQGGTCPKALGPSLTVVACGLAWAVTPLREALQPSKEEQPQTKDPAL